MPPVSHESWHLWFLRKTYLRHLASHGNPPPCEHPMLWRRAKNIWAEEFGPFVGTVAILRNCCFDTENRIRCAARTLAGNGMSWESYPRPWNSICVSLPILEGLLPDIGLPMAKQAWNGTHGHLSTVKINMNFVRPKAYYSGFVHMNAVFMANDNRSEVRCPNSFAES